MTVAALSKALDAKEFPFSDTSFETLADYAYRAFGLYLPLAKKSLVYSRLSKRVRGLNLKSVDTYISDLLNKQDTSELQVLVSLLTTNVTHFFREAHHFEHFTKHCIPQIRKKVKSNQRVRLWSAGCSSGQEAYSIAMNLMDEIPGIAEHDVKILATDLDSKMITIGMQGRYPSEEIRGFDKIQPEKYFVATQIPGEMQATPDLRKMVSFAELNLVDPWPFQGAFDAIFCRNVAIYFDAKTQATLWRRFTKQLQQQGVLYLGHSERLDPQTSQFFKATGVTAYSRL